MSKKNNILEEDFLLFISVDIINSTHMKYKNTVWTIAIKKFYKDFAQILFENCTNAEINRNKNITKMKLPNFNSWKKNGDELLFYISIIKAFKEINQNPEYKEEKQCSLVLWYIIAFKKAIISFNKKNHLKVKGTVWSGNIPVDNILDSTENGVDFIGKSIDIGFRLSKYAEIGKIVISVEVAILLMRDNFLTLRRNDIELLIQNRVPLKGVLNNIPYPIIWINLHEKIEDLELELFSKSQQNEITIYEYLEEFINITENELHYPFISKEKESEPFNSPWKGYEEQLI